MIKTDVALKVTIWILQPQVLWYWEKFQPPGSEARKMGPDFWNGFGEGYRVGVRGSEWQRQPTELISWRFLLSPSAGDRLQNVTFATLCSPTPSPHSYWGWTQPFPLIPASLPIPLAPNHTFQVNSLQASVLFSEAAVLSANELRDPNCDSRSSTNDPLIWANHRPLCFSFFVHKTKDLDQISRFCPCSAIPWPHLQEQSAWHKGRSEYLSPEEINGFLNLFLFLKNFKKNKRVIDLYNHKKKN